MREGARVDAAGAVKRIADIVERNLLEGREKVANASLARSTVRLMLLCACAEQEVPAAHPEGGRYFAAGLPRLYIAHPPYQGNASRVHGVYSSTQRMVCGESIK